MNGNGIWVLKSTDNKYLAPTVFTKFSNLTMGDCVPEQVYAARYYKRNEAASMAVRLGFDTWRIIRLRPAQAKKEC
jgi:hypothetical protein